MQKTINTKKEYESIAIKEIMQSESILNEVCKSYGIRPQALRRTGRAVCLKFSQARKEIANRLRYEIGLSNSEVGNVLNLSRHTVKYYFE